MAWKKAQFKGKEVWAEVNGLGQVQQSGGRVQIRFSAAAGARLYQAAPGNLLLTGSEIEDLPSGELAEPAAPNPAATQRGSGFGSAGSRTQGQAVAAAQDAKSRIQALPPETILAFTDGACNGNPGPAGSGVVLKRPGSPNIERYRALGSATNNVGELTAISMALELLEEEAVAVDASVALFTDSEYARGVLTLGWKAKANQDLIAGIREQIRRRPGIKLHWLAGHVGIPENERADALARQGAAESSRRR